ncbi:hemolysin family protein [Brevibacterium ihuae]|uniref:hemolysin family protein n=1 Tax=Brevibacterium ihuae TaxID=1631743 RepID=UPI000C7729F0|nr:hemolysin family protein [Brevibacterium ihuae]
MILTFFLLALVCLAAAAVLAAADAGLSAVSHHQVADAAEDGRRGAGQVMRILADLPTHINVLTFVRQVFEAMATVFVAMAYNVVFDASWQMVLCTVLTASIAVFVIAGISPRTIGRRRSLSVSLALGWLISGLRTALGPFARVLVWMGNMLTPAKVYRDGPLVSEEQLRDIVDRADVIEDDERDMIRSVFDLGDTRTYRVMVPRTDLVTVDAATPLTKAMTLFLRSGFSRVPVIDEDVDDIIGVLYLKDVARRLHAHPEQRDLSVRELARPVAFVPDTKAVDDLLRQMQRESTHVAVVIDEYGGTAGLITIEDIVEEIVGEIDDEHDVSDEDIVETAPGEYRVSTRTQIEDLAEHFDVRIEEEEVTTVGGLLTKEIGRVPIEGSAAVIAGLHIRALPGQGRRHRITHVAVTQEKEAVAP